MTTFKIIALILSLYVFAGSIDAEPNLSGMYPTTPVDRCLQAYEGTPNAAQCNELK